MKKTTVDTLDELRKNLETRVRNTTGPIAIIGGHYPINQDGIPLIDDDEAFGIFPKYTLELACQLVSLGKKLGKESKLTFMVDDHSQMLDSHWYMGDLFDVRERVEQYFREFTIPDGYLSIIQSHGLTEKDVLPSQFHPHAFQESKYREEFVRETGLDPGCAGEYRLILEDIAKMGIKTVLSFLPLRCQAPTCNSIGRYGAVESNPELTIIHVYLSSYQLNTNKEELEQNTVQIYGGIPIFSSTQCQK